jgi:hypothetical protein
MPTPPLRRWSMAILAAALLVPSTRWNDAGPKAGEGPLPRWDTVLAYEGKPNGRIVLFGGRDADRFFGDTWTWDGRAWTEQHPETSPSPRSDSAATFHVATGKIVAFGGYDGLQFLNDTWTWDGTTWNQESPAHSPPAGEDLTMAYHPDTRRAVLLTDENETWTWTGADWIKESPTDSPPFREAAAMASEAHHVLLFGGASCVEVCFPYDDTWRWDGRNWRELFPPRSPSDRWNAGLASYRIGQRVILFGGSPPALGDTWAWDGRRWQELSPSDTPSAREAPAVAYNPRTRQVVLFGGVVGDGELLVLGDTWVWDGTTWACRIECGPASAVG